MTLMDAPKNVELFIKDIRTGDEDFNAFLFLLGCYSGEPITIIQKRWNGCIVVIKNSRYNIDKYLANLIIV